MRADVFRKLVRGVAAEAGLSVTDVLSTHRGTPPAAHARRVAMWLVWASDREVTFTQVARLFGRERSAVADAINKFEAEERITSEARRESVRDHLLGRLAMRVAVMGEA